MISSPYLRALCGAALGGLPLLVVRAAEPPCSEPWHSSATQWLAAAVPGELLVVDSLGTWLAAHLLALEELAFFTQPDSLKILGVYPGNPFRATIGQGK